MNIMVVFVNSFNVIPELIHHLGSISPRSTNASWINDVSEIQYAHALILETFTE